MREAFQTLSRLDTPWLVAAVLAVLLAVALLGWWRARRRTRCRSRGFLRTADLLVVQCQDRLDLTRPPRRTRTGQKRHH